MPPIVQDPNSSRIEQLRQDEKALRREILVNIRQKERVEKRKFTDRALKELVETIMQRHVRKLRERYGLNVTNGKPIGETLTDY